MKEFKIIIDTREQKPWSFPEYETSIAKLDTGDYSIDGYQHLVGIERKRNVAEIANNITEDRFIDVVNRLSLMKYKYILLEFDLSDVMVYPEGSTIPKRLWSKIRISPAYILKNLIELQIHYDINIIFCSNSAYAENMALHLMKKIYKYEQQQNNI